MDRNKHLTSFVGPKPAVSATGNVGFFHGGSPSEGIPATIVTPDWANGVTEEIRNTIISAGLTPSINDDTQLSQAVSLLGSTGNLLINGQMMLAERFDSKDYGSGTIAAGATGKKYLCDRWLIDSVGTTYAASRAQTATNINELLPGNPESLLSVTTTSVTGAGNFCSISQHVENVRATAGRVCSLSFWSQTSVACNLSVAVYQHLGAESILVTAKKFSTGGTAWKRYVHTFDVPSIVGKTITSSANSLQVIIFLDAGTNFNAATESLGHQSITAKVTNCVLSFSSVPIDFFVRDDGLEVLLAARYYEKSCLVPPTKTNIGQYGALTNVQVVGAGVETLLGSVRFRTRKRIVPTVRLLNSVGTLVASVRNSTVNANSTTASVAFLNLESFSVMYTTASGSSIGDINLVHWDADAEFY